jgi:hypothetical protein
MRRTMPSKDREEVISTSWTALDFDLNATAQFLDFFMVLVEMDQLELAAQA